MIHDRSALSGTPAHDVALTCVAAGIERSLPERVVAEAITVDDATLSVDGTRYDLEIYEEILVVGGGNAAGKMAEALENLLGDRITSGAIVTDALGVCERVEQFEGAHPIPDSTNVEGAERVRELVAKAGEETLVLAVVTGGGSALLSAPAGDISLDDLRATTEELLASGATIHEMNAVRKHLSAIKGGQLAREAVPATTAVLVLSDVAGNDLDVIASGPTVPDSSTFADALAVVEEYQLAIPQSVRTRLERGANGDVPETPGSNGDAFDRVTTHVLADGLTAVTAAAQAGAAAGYEPLILSTRVCGEAREAAKTHVAIAEEIRASGHPIEPPAVLLSGGETTVTIRGNGAGGPNQEFALSSALELDEEGVVLASVDTDGIDGATDAAGAIVDAGTVESASAARAALADNDAYPYLKRTGALVFTGPTGTNVNDLRIVVIGEKARSDELDNSHNPWAQN